jgi:hypothetical protein
VAQERWVFGLIENQYQYRTGPFSLLKLPNTFAPKIKVLEFKKIRLRKKLFNYKI